MGISKWPYLSTNEVLHIPAVDDEHNELFERLENLKAHSFGRSDVLRQEADDLRECLINHFRTEQSLAEQAGIGFTQHAQIHEQMLQVVSLTLKQIYLGQGDIFGLIKYIYIWFERHIQESDTPFAAELRGQVPHGGSRGKQP